MSEESHDKSYGVDSSTSIVKSFHASRRMFAIKEQILILAPENVTYSHAKWFELIGWMTPSDDSLMTKITRGYFDQSGVYFYKGYDFQIDNESEKEMFGSLTELVEKTGISISLHLFGGKIKQQIGGDWPHRKDYGCIEELIKIKN